MARGARRRVRSTPIGAAAIIAAVLGWSFATIVVKIVHVPAITFAFYRLWISVGMMLVALVAARRRLTWAQVRASAPGGLLFGLNIVFFFSAIQRTNVADVLVIAALQPALTLMVAGPLFGERITRFEVGWTLVSVAGVALVVVGSSGTPTWSLGGDLLATASMIAWTYFFLVSKRVRSTVPALEYLAAVTVIGAVVVTPLALLSGQSLRIVRTADWLWLGIFLVGAQGGHLLLAWAHAQVDVSVSSLLILGEPIIAAVAALVILGEPITGLEVVGGVLVVAALAAIVRRATTTGRAVVEFEPVAPG
jgi:drug/metabolite transporter (DMT)-like permease